MSRVRGIATDLAARTKRTLARETRNAMYAYERQRNDGQRPSGWNAELERRAWCLLTHTHCLGADKVFRAEYYISRSLGPCSGEIAVIGVPSKPDLFASTTIFFFWFAIKRRHARSQFRHIAISHLPPPYYFSGISGRLTYPQRPGLTGRKKQNPIALLCLMGAASQPAVRSHGSPCLLVGCLALWCTLLVTLFE